MGADGVPSTEPISGRENTMKAIRLVVPSAVMLLMLAGTGCAHNNYYASPPPPQAQMPPLVQLADHNGFLTGRSDGARDANNGFAYAPRSSRAYHDTPGYDPQLGPFGAYRNAFRDAYLRGYDEGYHRR
jgi:hypothetical protein